MKRLNFNHLFGLIVILTLSQCDVPNTSPSAQNNIQSTIESVQVEEDFSTIVDFEDEEDSHVGGAEYTFIESLEYFDAKNYSRAIDKLNYCADYLIGDGEDLDEDIKRINATIEMIEQLIESLSLALETDLSHLHYMYSKVGMNMAKDYLNIAQNFSIADGEYYVNKAIIILDRVEKNLNGSEKKKVTELLKKLELYDQSILDGKNLAQNNLEKLSQQIDEILTKFKMKNS